MLSHVTDFGTRYVMFSQHCHELWIVIAEFDTEYVEYISGARIGEVGEPLGLRTFLHLHLVGPFNIFDYQHSLIFGRLAVTLTAQENLDVNTKKKNGKSKGSQGHEEAMVRVQI